MTGISQGPPQQKVFQALLTASAQCVLDGSGNGLAICGPSGTGSVWFPSQVGVSSTSTVKTPEAFLYLGPMLPVTSLAALMKTTQVTQIGGTSNGGNDSIGLVGITIPYGQAFIVQWQGGDAGAQAIMTVTGQQGATYWS